MKAFQITIVILIAGWLAFYLSSYGILINEKKLSPTTAGTSQAVLKCTYAMASRTTEVEFWFSKSGIMGKPLCPRLRLMVK